LPWTALAPAGLSSWLFRARIEPLLRAASADDLGFRLADSFHLIGGTSTAAIVAAGLAMGKPEPARPRSNNCGNPSCEGSFGLPIWQRI
jgi:hypothetical protein